ncbi:TPA: MFS transporter [Klebsiella pneumoniae]|uniref:MFS transporter n=1 Tax=Klebsiella TaxID=570 RepID=UPI0021182CD3|nr:MFS transporter [Klebsiella pneumoniae]HDU3661314.1 MFS transporter [Klebsiella pneumoniae subsp. pneumoniae]MBZ6715080.1 MFS transporter [Klebsiella pneumoniae]MCE0167256.1 MFS transporter [Klebsiella pneumoniae]MCE0417423.1 MFS transporter [Klebsiella pneumoniae]MCQ8625488.1 MFS transporter [Klebsiella pneumoniae]
MSITTSIHRPRASKEGVILILGSSLSIMGSVMIATVMPKIAAEFGITTPGANILIPLTITGPALAMAVCSPMVGWLADRCGRKNLLILATLLYAVTGMLPALLSSLNGIVFSRLVFGVCEAAIMTCCSTLIADYWHGHERSRFVNLQVVSIGFVGAIFFIVGGALGEHSWRMPFYLYLLPLLLVPFMIKILWEPITQHIPQPHSQSESQQINLAALLANYLLIFGGMVLAFVVPVQTPALLVQTGVTSSTLIGLSAGVGLLASLVGSLLWPLLRGQFGIMSVNVLLLSLAGIGLWLLVHATGYPHILVAVFIHGVGIGMLVPNTMLPVMNALSEKHRGKGMGVFTGCLYIGQFVSPLIVATLAGLTQGLVGAIQILSIASFGGALLWLVCDLIKRVHRVIINR